MIQMTNKRQIVIHSDYSAGDIEGPYRDARLGDILISPDKMRIGDDGYLELSHDGLQAKIESSIGSTSIDGIEIGSHIDRHLGHGADSFYVISTRAPTALDDGYAIGMRWLADCEYVCFSNAPLAAQWIKPTGSPQNIHSAYFDVILDPPSSEVFGTVSGLMINKVVGFAISEQNVIVQSGLSYEVQIVKYNSDGFDYRLAVGLDEWWSGPDPITIRVQYLWE